MKMGILEMIERMIAGGGDAKGTIAAAMASQRSGTAESFRADQDVSMNRLSTASSGKSCE